MNRLFPQHPTIPPDSWLWRSIYRNLGRQPRWVFPEIVHGNGLRFVRLHVDNYDALWPLLAQGDTTFVDREYRERRALYEQTLLLRANLPFTGNNGAVDYLVVNTPGKNQTYGSHDRYDYLFDLDLYEGEHLTGVVHLYELSHERLGDEGMPKPLVGIQLAAAYRGRGVADRALGLLEQFVVENYPKTSGVTAMIKRENKRSLRFFRRRGYVGTDEYQWGEEPTRDSFLVKTLR